MVEYHSCERRQMTIFLANLIVCISSLLFGYLIGSIPNGVILCKIFCGKDPRDYGSKSSGGTNVGRIFGKKLGIATSLLDGFKGGLPIIFVWLLINYCGIKDLFVQNYGVGLFRDGYIAIFLAPIGACIGHCWPIFANFKGGKAVACYIGFTIGTCWINFLISACAHLFTLKKSKYVSLASLISSILSVIIAWTLFALGLLIKNFDFNIFFWGFGITQLWAVSGLEYAIATTMILIIIVFQHRFNIKKISDGTENKIKWMK